MDKFQLNNLYNESSKPPVSSQLANRRADIKASRLPSDNNAKLAKINNEINKTIHYIKTKGNSPKAQRRLRTAKLKRYKLVRKMTNQGA